MSRIEQELAAREDLAERLRKLSQYYSEQPPKIRKREFVYVGAILAIIAYHLTAAPPELEVRHKRTPQHQVDTAVAAPQAAVYANIIAECLNGGTIKVGNESFVCKPEKRK